MATTLISADKKAWLPADPQHHGRQYPRVQHANRHLALLKLYTRWLHAPLTLPQLPQHAKTSPLPSLAAAAASPVASTRLPGCGTSFKRPGTCSERFPKIASTLMPSTIPRARTRDALMPATHIPYRATSTHSTLHSSISSHMKQKPSIRSSACCWRRSMRALRLPVCGWIVSRDRQLPSTSA